MTDYPLNNHFKSSGRNQKPGSFNQSVPVQRLHPGGKINELFLKSHFMRNFY